MKKTLLITILALSVQGLSFAEFVKPIKSPHSNSLTSLPDNKVVINSYELCADSDSCFDINADKIRIMNEVSDLDGAIVKSTFGFGGIANKNGEVNDDSVQLSFTWWSDLDPDTMLMSVTCKSYGVNTYPEMTLFEFVVDGKN